MKFEEMINKVIQGDCLEVMKDIPDNSIDMVLTDPPFMISQEIKITRGRNGMKFKGPDINLDFGDWDKFPSLRDYYKFTFRWLDECVRVLKPGRIIATWFDRDKINFVSCYLQKKYNFKCKGYFCHLKLNPVPQARKCLEENTFVIIQRENTYHFLKIKDVEINDKILTPNGLSRIKGIACSSEIIGKKIILSSGDSVISTKDHLFFKLKGGNFIAERVENIKVGDYIFVRLLNNIGLLDGNVDDYERGRFVGLYLAEGSKSMIKTKKGTIRTASVQFAFHRKEKELKDFIQKYASKLGFKSSIYQHKDENCDRVCISNSKLIKWIEKYVEGNNARNKKLTDLFLNESMEFLKGLIDGYYQGDGWFYRGKRKFSISSSILKEQLNTILLILGKWSIKKEKESKGFGKVYGKHYIFEIPKYIDEKRIPYTKGIFYKFPISEFNFSEKEIINKSLRYRLKKERQRLSDIRILKKQVSRNLDMFDNFSLLKVEKIENYKGKFYDIEIEAEDGQFLLANGILTHNCKWMNGWEEIGLWQKPGGKLVYNYQLGQHPDYMIVPIVGHTTSADGHTRLHPTQKPVKVAELFVSYWTNEGDIVLDPFAGSGTIGVASYLLDRNYILIEREEKYYKTASRRLSNLSSQMKMRLNNNKSEQKQMFEEV